MTPSEAIKYLTCDAAYFARLDTPSLPNEAVRRRIEELNAIVACIEALEAAVYHTRPGGPKCRGAGWTWKQQANFLDDRLNVVKDIICAAKDASE